MDRWMLENDIICIYMINNKLGHLCGSCACFMLWKIMEPKNTIHTIS